MLANNNVWQQQFNQLLEDANYNIVQQLLSIHISHGYLNHFQTFNGQNDINIQPPAPSKDQLQLILFTNDTVPIIHNFMLKQLAENLQYKISSIKANAILMRDRPKLFKRHTCAQQKEYMQKHKKIDDEYGCLQKMGVTGNNLNQQSPQKKKEKGDGLASIRQIDIKNQTSNKSEKLIFCAEDLNKLLPGGDLNDTIIENYIRTMQVLLPAHVTGSTFFFSSFFLDKLLGSFLKDDDIIDKDRNEVIALVKEKVKEAYKNVRRWTKNQDIFAKDVLVFPINSLRHWYCLLVVNPQALLRPRQGKNCEIIWCDSMFESREFIIQAIRMYLHLQILQKKRCILKELDRHNVPSYQLLLPRQTNTHDCGLYMLTYIEELLLRKNSQLINLSKIENRNKLNIFPRKLILKMRYRLIQFLNNLIGCKSQSQKIKVLQLYKLQREMIIHQNQNDYDIINQEEYHKYKLLNMMMIPGLSLQQKEYACLIRFYLDPQINFYQKDKAQ